MAQKIADIQKQIALLQAKIDKEVAGVISRIKVAIAAYDLTPEHLFGPKSIGGAIGDTKTVKSAGSGVKFTDGKGSVWVGRGPRPKWLREALAGGKRLEDFAVGTASASTLPLSKPVKNRVPVKKAKIAAKGTVRIKYKDPFGNTWTGRGSMPRWVKAALAKGDKIEDFLV